MKLEIRSNLSLSEKLYNRGLLMILLASTMLGFYLGHIRSFDSFLPHDLVPINNIKNFPINEKDYETFVKTDEIPGFIYTSFILSDVTNLSVDSLMFIPLGSIILPLGYAILVKHLSKEYLYALLLSLYLILDSGLMSGYYNIFKYTLTYFLGIIMLAALSFISFYKENTKTYYVMLIIIFLGLVLIHYTIAFIILLMYIIIYLIKSFKYNSFFTSKNDNISVYFLLILLIVLIITKSSTIITYFIQFNPSTSLDTFKNITNRISSYLFQVVQDKYVVYQEINQFSLFLRGIRALLLIIPLIFYVVLRYIFKVLYKPLPPLIWGIIFGTIIHAIIYINIGSGGIINNSMLVFYPILTVIVLQKITKFKVYIIVYLIFLITINGLSMLLSLSDINYSNRYESIKYSHIWYNKYLASEFPDHKEGILIDHKTMGLYAMISINERLFPLYFTTNRYDMLLDSRLTPDFKYLILHLDDKPIVSTRFNKYIAPINLINNINNNVRLNITSSDSLTVLYSTRSI
ncbi:MAG: hypothetical protein QW416_09205 [Candidatus Nitrosocaldaceae archaeon]